MNDSAPVCERCGRCCCIKLLIGDEVVFTPYFCRYFDKATRLCRVYERRHEVNPNCLTVAEGIELGVFPADCPFVRDLLEYRPPREHCLPEELDAYAREHEQDAPA